MQNFQSVEYLVKLSIALGIKVGMLSNNSFEVAVDEIEVWFIHVQRIWKEFQSAAYF